MEVNENRAKFTAHEIELSEDYPLGAEVRFGGVGQIIDEKRRTNHDGTFKRVVRIRPEYIKLKVFSEGKRIGETEELYVGGKSLSQKERELWWLIWDRKYKDKYGEFNDFYENAKERIQHLLKLVLDDELGLNELLMYLK